MPVVVVGCSLTATEASLNSMVAEISTNGRVAIVDNSGHWIPEEQPDRLAGIILETTKEGVIL
jgi:pimeloyl-ACP methyl ester carboxylesterase